MTYFGDSSFVLNRNAGTLTWTIGDPAAATSTLVRSGRGTLAINTTLAVGSRRQVRSTFSSTTVYPPWPRAGESEHLRPGLHLRILGRGANTAPDFLTYNAANGFQALAALYTSTDLTTSTATDVVDQTTAPTLSASIRRSACGPPRLSTSTTTR